MGADVVAINFSREGDALIQVPASANDDAKLNDLMKIIFQKHPLLNSEKIAIALGVIVGIASCWVFFPLGAAFGMDVENRVSSSDGPKMRAALYWFFGINSLIPLMSLGASSCLRGFRSIVSPEEIAFRNIPKEDMQILRGLFQVGNFALSTLAGAQRTYLTLITLPSLALKIPLGILTMLGTFLVYKRAFDKYEEKLLQTLFPTHCSPTSTQKKAIIDRFEKSLQVIKEMQNAEILSLYDTVFDQNADHALESAKAIYQLATVPDSNPLIVATTPAATAGVTVEPNNARKWLIYSSYVISIIASYGYYSLGTAMARACSNLQDFGYFNTTQNKINFSEADKSSEALKIILGVLVAMPIALIYLIATSRAFGSAYDAMTREKKPTETPEKYSVATKAFYGFSAFECILAGIPAVALFLQGVSDVASKALFIFLAIMGGTSAFAAQVSFSYFGIRTLTDEIVAHVTRESDSVEAKRELISTNLNTWISGLRRASNSAVEALPNLDATDNRSGFNDYSPSRASF